MKKERWHEYESLEASTANIHYYKSLLVPLLCWEEAFLSLDFMLLVNLACMNSKTWASSSSNLIWFLVWFLPVRKRNKKRERKSRRRRKREKEQKERKDEKWGITDIIILKSIWCQKGFVLSTYSLVLFLSTYSLIHTHSFHALFVTVSSLSWLEKGWDLKNQLGLDQHKRISSVFDSYDSFRLELLVMRTHPLLLISLSLSLSLTFYFFLSLSLFLWLSTSSFLSLPLKDILLLYLQLWHLKMKKIVFEKDDRSRIIFSHFEWRNGN